MAVYTYAVDVKVDATDLAAEALAKSLRDETGETVALYITDAGDWIVAPYIGRQSDTPNDAKLHRIFYAVGA